MKIAVVGLGDVGEACAHALASSDVASRLVLVNRTVARAEIAARDLRQARAWGRRLETEVEAAPTPTVLDGCELIVLTTGVRLRGQQDRRAVLGAAEEVFRKSGVTDSLRSMADSGSPSCVLVVTNPVELLVTSLVEQTGYRRDRLFGLGTMVESARCSDHLGRGLDVDARSAWVHVLGEHGKGVALPDLGRLHALVSREELERRAASATRRMLEDAAMIRGVSDEVGRASARRLVDEVRTRLDDRADPAVLQWLEDELGAALAPPATRFAIAACVVEVARAIATDSSAVLTLSALPPPRLALPEVAISLPYAVRRGGLGRCFLDSAPDELREIAAQLRAARTPALG